MLYTLEWCRSFCHCIISHLIVHRPDQKTYYILWSFCQSVSHSWWNVLCSELFLSVSTVLLFTTCVCFLNSLEIHRTFIYTFWNLKFIWYICHVLQANFFVFDTYIVLCFVPSWPHSPYICYFTCSHYPFQLPCYQIHFRQTLCFYFRMAFRFRPKLLVFRGHCASITFSAITTLIFISDVPFVSFYSRRTWKNHG